MSRTSAPPVHVSRRNAVDHWVISYCVRSAHSATTAGASIEVALDKYRLPIAQVLTMVSKLKPALFPPLVLAALLIGLCRVSLAQGDADLDAPGLAPFPTSSARGVTLFQNVRVFDGKSCTLSAPSDVLVKGNTIERISASPIPADTNPDFQIIAANGRVLMPGLH
jgi:hypothetical protein